MKPRDAFCISVVVSNDNYELAMAELTMRGMEGCEEQSVPNGYLLRIFFIDKNAAEDAAVSLQQMFGNRFISFAEAHDEDHFRLEGMRCRGTLPFQDRGHACRSHPAELGFARLALPYFAVCLEDPVFQELYSM